MSGTARRARCGGGCAARGSQRARGFALRIDREREVCLGQASGIVAALLGAVPSVLFGRKEACIIGMHKGYDEAIGHDAAAAVRSNSAAMGISPTR